MAGNVHDILPCGKAAYEKRFGEPFPGSIIPFVAAITYKPTNLGIIAQMTKMGKKNKKGLFMGYDLQHGGGHTDQMWVLGANEY